MFEGGLWCLPQDVDTINLLWSKGKDTQW